MASKKISPAASAERALASRALSLPEAYEENPWGHRAFKVKKKVFVFLGTEDLGLSLSVKLPESAAMALTLPFASPTRYGLGKSGWVSAKFAAGEPVPTQLLLEWIDESYRAIAPKKLVAQLGA